jgi:hypothetical protein
MGGEWSCCGERLIGQWYYANKGVQRRIVTSYLVGMMCSEVMEGSWMLDVRSGGRAARGWMLDESGSVLAFDFWCWLRLVLVGVAHGEQGGCS